MSTAAQRQLQSADPSGRAENSDRARPGDRGIGSPPNLAAGPSGLDEYVRTTVALAPPLTPEQRERLARLLRHDGRPGPRGAKQPAPGRNRKGSRQ
jgi:hypothetical protein